MAEMPFAESSYRFRHKKLGLRTFYKCNYLKEVHLSANTAFKEEHFGKDAGSSVTEIPIRNNRGNTIAIRDLSRWEQSFFPDSTFPILLASFHPRNLWQCGCLPLCL